MSKLHNVRGRITYISSHAKQENLYAVYETTERHYWTELARFNQQEFLKSGTDGKCIEARELIIALPESFPDLYYPDKLLQLFTNRFKEKYGVEYVSALHHNKRKTNYHIHLIFSERELLPEPIEKIATRNMFYNEHGKHVRTKKEILDDSGNIRKGCKVIKKGEVYERILFTTKNKLFHESLEKEYSSKATVKEQSITTVDTTSITEEANEPEPPKVTVTTTVSEAEVVEQPKPEIPPRPAMPPEAAAFPKLQKIKITLDKHNHLIFEAEHERAMLEIERDDLRGFARLTKKRELDCKIDCKNEEIRTLKAGLSGIVKQHGFATVQDFYTAFYTVQRAIEAYEKACAKWEESYGAKATPKAEFMHEKLQRYQEEADRQNANRPYQSRDKGTR